jgi:hypothetical protein
MWLTESTSRMWCLRAEIGRQQAVGVLSQLKKRGSVTLGFWEKMDMIEGVLAFCDGNLQMMCC